MITGSGFCAARRSRQISRPPRPGSIKSSTMRSMGSSRSRTSICSAFPAAATLKPSRFKVSLEQAAQAQVVVNQENVRCRIGGHGSLCLE
jgi:hypothetical protein